MPGAGQRAGKLPREPAGCGTLAGVNIAQSARSGRGSAPRARSAWRRRPPADSLWWPGTAAAAFTLAQLVFVVPRLGLSWDETVYASQVSLHLPAAYFDPARARGIPLLIAPVAAFTSSATALHVYLAFASGLGLFAALAVWRALRPGWLLALAGPAFAGLWVTQYYGPQAMPDLWLALAALAAVGFFLRAVGPGPAAAAGTAAAGTGATRTSAGTGVVGPEAVRHPPLSRGALAGLAGALAFAALVRPGDAVFLAACLAGAVLVPGWRRWRLLVAVAAGLAAGGAEWVIEAWARFGGPLHRLHLAGTEQGGFGLHPALWDELRAVNGPTLCRPCTIGYRYPELSLWWLALPLLAALGIWAARRDGLLRSSLLPTLCALGVGFQYLFLIGYAAPRFLLPAYALLAIPVADALGWLLTSVPVRWQETARMVVGLALVLQVIAQHLVLAHEVRGTVRYHADYQVIAADLHRLGVRPPCVIKGEQFIPIAYLAGCASAGSANAAAAAGRAAVLEFRQVPPPRYARDWRRYPLPGTHVLELVGYLPPGR